MNEATQSWLDQLVKRLKRGGPLPLSEMQAISQRAAAGYKPPPRGLVRTTFVEGGDTVAVQLAPENWARSHLVLAWNTGIGATCMVATVPPPSNGSAGINLNTDGPLVLSAEGHGAIACVAWFGIFQLLAFVTVIEVLAY